MTDTEAKNLSDRIIALDLPKEQQAIETAREFQRIAAQCGWQREEVARLQRELEVQKALLQSARETLTRVLGAK